MIFCSEFLSSQNKILGNFSEWDRYYSASEGIRLQKPEEVYIPLIPGIYDILNQEEGSVRFFQFQMKAKFMSGQMNSPSLSGDDFISSLQSELGLIYPFGLVPNSQP